MHRSRSHSSSAGLGARLAPVCLLACGQVAAQFVPGNADPTHFATNPFGSFALFAARDRDHGTELWRTTGTSATTSLVADIRNGVNGSYPREIVGLGNRYLFVADDGVHGSELWITDGTAAGTTMVRDIRSGIAASDPQALTLVPSATGFAVFFVADDGVHGREPWYSDGTAAGTFLLQDIRPGAAGSNPSHLTLLGDQMILAADDGGSGSELWACGTTAGSARLVRDIAPGSGSSSPAGFTRCGNGLLFAATEPTAGRELWTTDGVTAARVADLRPGALGSDPVLQPAIAGCFVVADDGVVGRELWWTDGASVALVADVRPGPASSNIASLTTDGVGVWFVADDGVHGNEIWRCPGPGTGAAMVADLVPGGGSASPTDLCVLQYGTILFAAEDPTSSQGRELWRSDGAAANTQVVRDINPGAAGSRPTRLRSSTSLFTPGVYFVAETQDKGQELWHTYGTFADTTLVKDIAPVTGGIKQAYLEVSHDIPADTVTICIYGCEPNRPAAIGVDPSPLAVPIDLSVIGGYGFARILPALVVTGTSDANGTFCVGPLPLPGGTWALMAQGYYFSTTNQVIATDGYALSVADSTAFGSGRSTKTVGRFSDDHRTYGVSLRLTGFTNQTQGKMAMYLVWTETENSVEVVHRRLLDKPRAISVLLDSNGKMDLDWTGGDDNGVYKGQKIPWYIELLWFENEEPSDDGTSNSGGLAPQVWRSYC